MWKRFQEKEETPQLNKVFMKNGNVSNICENAFKKRGNTSLNKVFKVFLKNGNASKKKRKHLNYKYWETTQKYSEIPDPFPVLRDFPK